MLEDCVLNHEAKLTTLDLTHTSTLPVYSEADVGKLRCQISSEKYLNHS